MKRKIVLYFVLITALFACQPNTSSDEQDFALVNGEKIPIIRVDLVADSTTTIGWSALFDEVNIIPLETSERCLIRNWRTGLSPNSLFLATQTGRLGPTRLMEFDFEGKYLRDFGAGGKGPGEHTGYLLGDVRYYLETEQVLADFNGYPEEKHLFTRTGEFIANIKSPFELAGKTIMINPELYLTLGSIYGKPTYYRDSVLLEWHTQEGEVVKSIGRTIYPPENNNGFTPISGGRSLYRSGTIWRLFSPGNDTIYTIKGQEISQYAIFEFGNQYVQLNKIIDPSEVIGRFMIQILSEDDNYWILKKSLVTVCDVNDYGTGQWGGMWDFNESFIVIDKSNGKSWNLSFEDDLLGIIPWKTLQYSLKWDESGKVYIIIGALDLVEWIDAAFDEGNITEPQLSKIRNLRQKIDENSNPVLFMLEKKRKFDLIKD
ncbi:MAG: 6-bladed beta-propeller [Bacteroidetes bacterium]|nr:6-bladed beta-propeller [Bacteroidota bacterium]MBT4401060.1 6-bladed beta-propeller [Bacteroidota bacterium]MBT4410792.1 6-bladed beta-propeller [Bacteroidota bacterium]MBT5425112.1 6-bladed beta-propeller [Bacteroidota bacterium]MBT7092582.1 6-bladed beta-propeller [Bacteroidota bacterium]